MIGYFEMSEFRNRSYYSVSNIAEKILNYIYEYPLVDLSYATEKHLISMEITSNKKYSENCADYNIRNHPEVVTIRDLKTNTCIQYNVCEASPIYNCNNSPNVLFRISEKGIAIIDNLTVIMYNAIIDTQRMPKQLWIKPGTTISDILKIPQVTKWLPKGMSFDLDRQPDNKWVTHYKLHDDNDPNEPMNWCMGFLAQNQNGLGDFVDYSTSDPLPLEYWCRWIRYCDHDEWSHSSWSGYIPFEECPRDQSLITIPMKHENDKYTRDYLDSLRMYVQIRYITK